MTHEYWRKQTPSNPLFPEVEWNKPERRDQAGKLGIIGGNQHGFAGVAAAYTTALDTGVGELRVLLPDSLKNTVPKSITDVIYSPSTASGGLAKDALNDMKSLGVWADGILLVGDAGKNSETAVVYEQFISSYNGKLTLTRDAIDLVANNSQMLVERPDTLLVASFAQAQKIFRAVYYPKMLTFNMQLLQFVEALHKFTITYPVTLVSLHQGNILVAHGGDVVTQEWDSPMRIWRGEVATVASVFYLWNASKTLNIIAGGIVSMTRKA